MKSIQNKILAVVILGLLVITAAVSTIAVKMSHEIMHKDADRILDNMTQKEAAYINDILGDVSKSAAIMEHYALGEIASIEQLKDQEFLDSYLESTEQMFKEIALNTSGIEGFFFRLNPHYTTGTTGYYHLIGENSAIKEMQVSDLTKYAEDDEQNVSWYYTSVREGKAVWLNPYYFPGHSKKLISYTVPMYVGSELLGVIGFDMDFESFVARIDDISVYENGHAVLVDKDGVTRYNNQDKNTDEDTYATAVAELDNGMYLEIRAGYSDIQKEIRPMLTEIVKAFLIVLLCAIAYTIAVTHRIVHPLKQLTAEAEKISAGADLKVSNFNINSDDEIGTLARVLRNTYERIQEYTAYINALAYRDSLTGIKNSSAYIEATNKLDREINCGNPQFGVLVADINNLKKTNDRFGHDVGNELIIHTAKILMDIFKTSIVFRVGGDEFVVIMTGKDYEDYHGALMRLDEACSQDYVSAFEHRIPLSLARGVAVFDATIDRIYKDVFVKADHAMYMHKEQIKSKDEEF